VTHVTKKLVGLKRSSRA